MFKIDKKKADSQWVKFEKDNSVEILIKPLSIYYFQKLPSGEMDMTSKQFGELICQLIVDWKGVFDEDGKELKCTEENKMLVADHAQDLAGFVMTKASDLKAQITSSEKEIKN